MKRKIKEKPLGFKYADYIWRDPVTLPPAMPMEKPFWLKDKEERMEEYTMAASDYKKEIRPPYISTVEKVDITVEYSDDDQIRQDVKVTLHSSKYTSASQDRVIERHFYIDNFQENRGECLKYLREKMLKDMLCY